MQEVAGIIERRINSGWEFVQAVPGGLMLGGGLILMIFRRERTVSV